LDALKVMSFNVRGSFRDLGKQEAWPNRAAENVATIRRHAPHLVGLQECQRGNLSTYREHLPRYEETPRPTTSTPSSMTRGASNPSKRAASG
jgi:endonuclease/exonuclease/phosphatase family metal-dependent hydrolase